MIFHVREKCDSVNFFAPYLFLSFPPSYFFAFPCRRCFSSHRRTSFFAPHYIFSVHFPAWSRSSSRGGGLPRNGPFSATVSSYTLLSALNHALTVHYMNIRKHTNRAHSSSFGPWNEEDVNERVCSFRLE